MKYSLLISFFVLILAYPTEQDDAKSQIKAKLDIDGKNYTIPDTGDVIPPEPFSPTDNPVTTTTANTNISTTTTSTTSIPSSNGTTPKPLPTKPTTIPSTTTKPTTITTITPPPSTTSPTTPPSPSTPTSSTAPTTINPPVPTTVKPEPSTVKPEPERRFDGPSFVGGIVLALGLVAIGFVAFKFYKARTELNYHTL